MKNSLLTVLLIANGMSSTLVAAAMPSQGNIELNFGGSLEHYSNRDYLNLRAEAAWFLTDKQQFGGGFSYARSEQDNDVYQGEMRSVNLLYRYNFIEESRGFFPYIGSRLSYREYENKYEDFYGPGTTRIEEEQTVGELHGGVKFMLNQAVAWDNGLAYQKVLDGDEAWSDSDWWVVQTGLSVFF